MPYDDQLNALCSELKYTRTQTALLIAITRCFEKWGIHKTTYEDVISEAGVSRATAYRAFPSFVELKDAVTTTQTTLLQRFLEDLCGNLDRSAVADRKKRLVKGVQAVALEAGSYELFRQLQKTDGDLLEQFVWSPNSDRLVRAVSTLILTAVGKTPKKPNPKVLSLADEFVRHQLLLLKDRETMTLLQSEPMVEALVQEFLSQVDHVEKGVSPSHPTARSRRKETRVA